MSKFLLGLIVLAIGALVGWYTLGGKTQIKLPTALTITTKTTPSPTVSLLSGSDTLRGTQSPNMEKGGVASRSVVTYSATGFSPTPLTIKAGTTVTFVNESSGGMWVASAVHPSHKVLPGFDQLKSAVKGGTYEYTFTKIGTWKYHNHVAPGDAGSVVVIN